MIRTNKLLFLIFNKPFYNIKLLDNFYFLSNKIIKLEYSSISKYLLNILYPKKN